MERTEELLALVDVALLPVPVPVPVPEPPELRDPVAVALELFEVVDAPRKRSEEWYVVQLDEAGTRGV